MQAPNPIVATRQIAAAPEAVSRFLMDLENHVRLAPGSVEVLSLDRRADFSTHALVRLRGPLAIKRTASTELLRTPTPSSILGRARIGDGTVASVSWTIHGRGDGSAVTLRTTIDTASPLDRLLLRLGARRWVARHFTTALDRLADELAPAHVPSLDSSESAPLAPVGVAGRC